MGDLALRDVRKTFGHVEVIKGVDLDIKSGEFVVFVGPSGCGKSTLLRLIAGLEEITSGTVEFDGEARVRPDRHESVAVTTKIPASAVGQKGTLGVRPENLSLANGGAQPLFHGRLDILEHLGELTLLYVDCGYQEPIIAKLEGYVQIERGSEVTLAAPSEVLHVFDNNGHAFPRP